MQQLNDFGLFLKYHYLNFIPKEYNQNEVLVRSTNYDRTLMSTHSLLSGLFEPIEIKNGTKIHPVPIRTNDADEDNIFHLYGKCPILDHAYEKIAESAENLDVVQNNKVIKQHEKVTWLN
jgi:hypothetical protein